MYINSRGDAKPYVYTYIHIALVQLGTRDYVLMVVCNISSPSNLNLTFIL